MIFVVILGGDQTKQKKIDLVICKISHLVHLETTRVQQNLMLGVCGLKTGLGQLWLKKAISGQLDRVPATETVYSS